MSPILMKTLFTVSLGDAVTVSEENQGRGGTWIGQENQEFKNNLSYITGPGITKQL